MISTKMISNCTIPLSDIINTIYIYGPLLASLEVNSIGIKPMPLVKDEFKFQSICTKNSNIELCIDVVHINGVAFLVSIDKKVK